VRKSIFPSEKLQISFEIIPLGDHPPTKEKNGLLLFYCTVDAYQK
jgi:hypothetical protein